jgi:hypothetical protein
MVSLQRLASSQNLSLSGVPCPEIPVCTDDAPRAVGRHGGDGVVGCAQRRA